MEGKRASSRGGQVAEKRNEANLDLACIVSTCPLDTKTVSLTVSLQSEPLGDRSVLTGLLGELLLDSESLLGRLMGQYERTEGQGRSVKANKVGREQWAIVETS